MLFAAFGNLDAILRATPEELAEYINYEVAISLNEFITQDVVEQA